jgi:hypothetical protein
MTRGFVDGEYQDGEIRGLVFICGMRGMGKTWLMDQLLGSCGGGVVFIESLSKHAGVLRGYKVLSQPGALEEYLRVNLARRFHVLYQPRAGSLDEHFQSVCTCVRVFGKMILAIDELDKLCGPRWGDSRMCPELDHLVNYGRHEQVSMIATARRPTGVPRGYTAEAELRLFKIKEQAYLDYFADLVGKDSAARLRTLDKFQYLHCRDDSEAELCGGRR